MSDNTNVIGNPIVTHVQVTDGNGETRPDANRVAIPQGDVALRGLRQVDPQSEPVEDR